MGTRIARKPSRRKEHSGLEPKDIRLGYPQFGKLLGDQSSQDDCSRLWVGLDDNLHVLKYGNARIR